jgi:hypothetical protein
MMGETVGQELDVSGLCRCGPSLRYKLADAVAVYEPGVAVEQKMDPPVANGG